MNKYLPHYFLIGCWVLLKKQFKEESSLLENASSTENAFSWSKLGYFFVALSMLLGVVLSTAVPLSTAKGNNQYLVLIVLCLLFSYFFVKFTWVLGCYLSHGYGTICVVGYTHYENTKGLKS